MNAPLLSVRDLRVAFPTRQGMFEAVRGVSFDLGRERLGVVGESGSGKSTVARVVAGLLAPAAGTVKLAGTPLASTIAGRTREQLRRVQIVFQSADVALNPARSVSDILGRGRR